MLSSCWLAPVPMSYTHGESGYDSDGNRDHGIKPGKHREGEDSWWRGPKS